MAGLRRHNMLSLTRFVLTPLGPRTNALGRFLHDFCRYSPILILWNGSPLNRPLIGESGRLVGSVCCLSPNAEMDGAGYEKNMIGCSAAFQIVKNAPTYLSIVVDGIALTLRLQGQKGHRIVVAGKHLNYGLSGLKVIADAKLKSTLEFLQEFLGRWARETG